MARKLVLLCDEPEFWFCKYPQSRNDGKRSASYIMGSPSTSIPSIRNAASTSMRNCLSSSSQSRTISMTLMVSPKRYVASTNSSRANASKHILMALGRLDCTRLNTSISLTKLCSCGTSTMPSSSRASRCM